MQRLAERAAGIAGGARQRVLAGEHGERLGVALVEHLEMAGDIGLEGELVEEALAEGVDGLDLQPARRLQRAGEEPPRVGERRLVGRRCSISWIAAASLASGSVVHLAEDVEDALRHLGGGGLVKVRQRMRAGIGAGEQQADDAIGEHVGLARAGIGRHPGRGARVRGVGLRLPRRGVDG